MTCYGKEKNKMEKPKIFVSFDFENDRNYKYTLNIQVLNLRVMINHQAKFKAGIYQQLKVYFQEKLMRQRMLL